MRNEARFDELNASAPFDPERRLTGEGGAAVIAHVLDLMATSEDRGRPLTKPAARKRALTVEVLIANIAVAALNRVDPNRYAAVPFNRSRYGNLGLSYDAMVLARNALLAGDLIDYAKGFYRRHHIDFLQRGQLSRIRAKPALRELFDDLAVRRWSVTHEREKLIKLNRAEVNAGPEPECVTASRAILVRINARIEAAEIVLSDDAWDRIALKRRTNPKGKKKAHIQSADDATAKALYRAFTGNWMQGGRLYGGWWQNLDSEERRHLTINGEAVAEIDFRNAHPALLYRVLGKPLDRDPYVLPPYSRELCKETFQRLMNRSAGRGGADIKRAKKHKPPNGTAFATFLADYKHHLSAVADCFGKSVGVLLQREDSDLALAILDRLDAKEVIALPVHDSFIVTERHRAILDVTMREVYRSRYGIDPFLKPGWV